ncbi:HNH endonuclease signature motif containing protein [Microbacterium telephonicum]|uniref:HNH endonuclease n=1 Tax=Microbacterium telephonicum TaxID=1714841 RepID=A0A498C445_9MICO|nr:HNH endonuclease signature motif containing protein [Microbacterium telephonicum]RLK47598.1 HNH endonuclease [Microbacterium telephonicum]
MNTAREATTPCVIWEGAIQTNGYGSTSNGHGGSMLAHRAAWEREQGPIPANMTVDHLCRQRLCVNIEHMEIVTRGENTRRAMAAITHCAKGHPLSGDNLRLKRRRDGYTQRVCITCARAQYRAWYERQKSA